MKQAVRFVTSTASVYIATVGVMGYVIYPAPTFDREQSSHITANTQPLSLPEKQPEVSLIAGKPVRIVVPDYGIDLPVDEGHYNEADGSWTLSEAHAQYAMMTALANNLSGNTLIYGHGTDAVFGKLSSPRPAVGTIAEVYTDNNHVFRYAFTDSRDLTPTDTSVLDETNTPATLTIQTCTGMFSEWRTMFRFTLESMIQ